MSKNFLEMYNETMDRWARFCDLRELSMKIYEAGVRIINERSRFDGEYINVEYYFNHGFSVLLHNIQKI